MGTISKPVQDRMERFRQKLRKLHGLGQAGWGDAAHFFCDREKKYGTTEFKVLAVVRSQREDNATSSAPTTFGEPMETLDSVPGKLQMPQVTSQLGSSQMRLGLWKPWTHDGISSWPPAPEPESSMIQIWTHVDPVSYNPCTWLPKLITI